MSPKVFQAFETIVRRHWPHPPTSVLELGAGSWTLLDIPHFKDARRVALNFQKPTGRSTNSVHSWIVANGNHLPVTDNSLDCILSSSMLEHDKYFWRTTQEACRVLRSGGLYVVGVPIYMTLPTDLKNTTLTFRRHGMAYNADFYRFSEQAVREVLLEHLEVLDSCLVRRFPNPYLVAAGRKP